MNAMGRSGLRKFYFYILGLSFGYMLITSLTLVLKTNATLVDVVTLGKLISMAFLIIVNGEIAKDIDRNQFDIKIVNITILVISICILIVSTVKFFAFDPSTSKASMLVQSVLTITSKHIMWISTFPLIGYALLDFYIAYLRVGTLREKEIAIKFFVFVDLACILPLFLVFLSLFIYSNVLSPASSSLTSKDSIELFMSGSMAIVLLASSLATKAVEEYLSASNDMLS